MFAYRTTSGQLIDLWSLSPDHLGTASRLAALIQQRIQSSNHRQLNEETIRAEVQFHFGFMGLHRDSPDDDALGVFVLDLVSRWIEKRQVTTTSSCTGVTSWRQHLRARLIGALGLRSCGGKTRIASELGIDQSGGSRFASNISSPYGITSRTRGDLLNQVELLLDQRTLRLAVVEGVPSDLVDGFGMFLRGRRTDLSYGEERVLLAVSRLVRAHQINLEAPSWEGLPAKQADLAWVLGGDTSKIGVNAITDWFFRLLGVPMVSTSLPILHIPMELCGDPDVQTAFHMGLFDGSGVLPIPIDPATIYRSGVRGTTTLNDGHFFPEAGLREALGRAAQGPFTPPGKRLMEVPLQPESTLDPDGTILKEARRLRYTFPLAIWIATGGVVEP